MSLRLAIVATATGALVCVSAVASAQNPFKHQGLDAMHAPDSAMRNESVDPASGTLTIVETDLALPGNAGFNLAIQRVYNSAVYPDYDSGGSTALEEDSWAGIGWRLHFGRILHSDSTSAGQIQVEMGDGSRHPFYHSIGNPNIWTTSDFWQYNAATHTLLIPNGLVYIFDREIYLNDRLGTVRYVTEIHDPFNNRVDVLLLRRVRSAGRRRSRSPIPERDPDPRDQFHLRRRVQSAPDGDVWIADMDLRPQPVRPVGL